MSAWTVIFDCQTFATQKLRATSPQTAELVNASVLVMRESTAVTVMCRHTLDCPTSVRREEEHDNSLGVTVTEILHLPGNVTKREPEFLFLQWRRCFPYQQEKRQAINSSTTCGVIDHQSDVGHNCFLKSPVSTASPEIILQYIFCLSTG